MSFNTITGTMGGGKSMMAAGLIRDYLKKGRKVYTNVAMLPLQMEKHGIPLHRMDDDNRVEMFNPLPKDFSLWVDQIEYSTEGHENLIIIEEAGEYFFVGKKDNKAVKEELYLLIKDSRHKGLAIWFIEQNFANLDVQLRRMAQHEYHCTALKDMPLVGSIAVWLKGDFKRGIHQGGENKEMTATYHRFDNSLAVIYKTDNRAPTEFQKPEGVVVRQKAKMSGMSWLLLGVFTLVPVLMLYCGNSLYQRISGKDKALPAKAAPVGLSEIDEMKLANRGSVDSFGVHPVSFSPVSSSAPVGLNFVEIGGHPIREDRFHTLFFVEFGSLILHTSSGVVAADGLIDGFPVVSIQRYGAQAYLVLDAQPAWHFVRTVSKPVEANISWPNSSPDLKQPPQPILGSGQRVSVVHTSPPSSKPLGKDTPPALSDGAGRRYVTGTEYRAAKDKSGFEHRGTDIVEITK